MITKCPVVVNSTVRAQDIEFNHNETLLRTAPRTDIEFNHNETLLRRS